MYLNILRKELKRKKAMNIILTLFIIISAMFVSSSVNNIVSIMGALDYFSEKAGMTDYMVSTVGDEQNAGLIKILDNSDDVESYGMEQIYFIASDNITRKGMLLPISNGSIIVSVVDNSPINYFDENDEIIRSIPEGMIYISGNSIPNGEINIGDILDIKNGDGKISLKVGGVLKDVVFGSDMMSSTRFAISQEDYDKIIDKEGNAIKGALTYVNGKDSLYLGEYNSYMIDKEMMKFSYIIYMIIAGIILVVSVCLILVAFMVLKFTIGFTLSEEYREIGVMKAIGIKNVKIRGLYMTKYLALSIFGAAIGFFLSIPFGNMLLETVSSTIVMGNDNALSVNLGCSVLVVVIIMLFCFSCTRMVNKITPIDAIRNGTTGERFSRKSALKLSRIPAKPSFFMALNDVLSAPKRFVTIIITYTLCLLLILILANSAGTLRSGDLMYALGCTESDLYYEDDDKLSKCLVKPDIIGAFEDYMADTEKKLKDNNLPAECGIELFVTVPVKKGDNMVGVSSMHGFNITSDKYRYYEGTVPQNVNEVALTPITAGELGADIGDTVIITLGGEEKECIVTAFFQGMNNMGHGIKLHHDTVIPNEIVIGTAGMQIDFADNPDDKTIEERKETVNKILGTENVYTADEYADECIGVAEIIDSVKYLVLAISATIIILVTVLMERSFIANERGEIAIMKAIGFRDSVVMKWHTIRFGIIVVISAVIGAALNVPLTMLTINPVFSMMGANYGVEFKINPLEVFLIYPVIVLLITVISAYLTSIYTKSIKASEASSIE